MESLGNTFAVLRRDDLPARLDFAKTAISLCHHHTGIGTDGLLVLDRGRLQMFNPDGTEDFCGNGLRCAGALAHQFGWIEDKSILSHHGLDVEVKITGPKRVWTRLPAATFDPELTPHSLQSELFESDFEVDGKFLRLSALSTGTTHCVLLCEHLPDDEQFLRFSPALERHPLFPERTSVIWVRPESQRVLSLRIWERGVGETLGCGTGSAAAAVTWSRREGITGQIDVENPGGRLSVHLERWDGPIELESDVRILYEGIANLDLFQLLQSTLQRA